MSQATARSGLRRRFRVNFKRSRQTSSRVAALIAMALRSALAAQAHLATFSACKACPGSNSDL